MSSRFPTLLLREWMQHKRGWLLTLILPPAIVLAILPFGHTDGVPNQALAAGLIIVLISVVAMLAITSISIGLQLPGLARRDVQDRSIEFWLSLPSSHSESLAATLLTHVLLVPLAAVVFGFFAGYVMTAGVVLKLAGPTGLAAIPWGAITALALPAVARIMAGVVLALVWLAPLVLLLMAASAWLKRWSVAAVAAALVITCTILPGVYGFVAVRDWLNHQMHGAWNALLADPQTIASSPEQIDQLDSTVAWHWVISDFTKELQGLISLQMASGLVIAAIGFYLLVLRRQRAG